MVPHTNSSLLSSTEILVFNITLPIISIIGVITNMTVILGMMYDRGLRNAVTNNFVVNLACADVLVLVVGVPIWVIQFVIAKSSRSNLFTCQITFGLTSLSSVLSIYTLGVISYDRYLAVTKPFQYHRIMTKQRSNTIIVGLWVIAIGTSLPSFIGWKSTKIATVHPDAISYCAYTRVFRQEYLLVGFSGISFVIIMNILIYVRLLRVARSHARRIETLEQELETNSCMGQTVSRGRREKNIKAARTLGIVLGVLVVCWVPFLVILFIDTANPNLGISVFATKALGTVTYLNSILDPIIYTYMSRDFRKAIRRLLRRRGSENM